MTTAIRVVVVDDQELVRTGFRMIGLILRFRLP